MRDAAGRLVGVILGPCRCQGCGRLVWLWRGKRGVEWQSIGGGRHRC